MRSSSIWVPLFIAGAGAAVTALVVAQRHTRLSPRTEERRVSGPTSQSVPGDSASELRPAAARSPYETADFDPDPDIVSNVDATPPSVPELGEAYDAVNADDLANEWLARATESLPVNRSARSSDGFEELATRDLLDEEPLSLPELELDPEPNLDSTGPIESEAVLADREAKEREARQNSAHPLPAVFDIAELLQDNEASSNSKRRS